MTRATKYNNYCLKRGCKLCATNINECHGNVHGYIQDDDLFKEPGLWLKIKNINL